MYTIFPSVCPLKSTSIIVQLKSLKKYFNNHMFTLQPKFQAYKSSFNYLLIFYFQTSHGPLETLFFGVFNLRLHNSARSSAHGFKRSTRLKKQSDFSNASITVSWFNCYVAIESMSIQRKFNFTHIKTINKKHVSCRCDH